MRYKVFNGYHSPLKQLFLFILLRRNLKAQQLSSFSLKTLIVNNLLKDQMDSPSSFSQAKTFLYVISFSFLELCFLFLLLRRNHGLMPERKGKKIKHFFGGLYKKLMAFFRRQHPCWSTHKIFKICLSLVSFSIFTQTNTA